MFRAVYENPVVRAELDKAKGILRSLYAYYLENTDEAFHDVPIPRDTEKHRLVCDFIAGMTDQFALMTYEKLFLPQQWKVL